MPEGDAVGLCCGFPVLDAQAKAEYKRRINELQQELEEAERVNDAQRKTEIQNGARAADALQRLDGTVGGSQYWTKVKYT